MIKIDFKNNISDANASGRGLSSAPWMNCNKSSYNIKEVQDGGWQSGRSMIEMLGVLAIIGVLSVGGIAGYSKAMMKYRINKTIEQITLISGNIRSFFGQQKDYADLDSTSSTGKDIIKKAKLVPDEMIEYNTDGTIKRFTNPFGDVASIRSVDKSTEGDNQAFSIAYFIEDNTEACIELLTQDWSAAGVKAFYLEDAHDFHNLKAPIAVDTAVTHCSTGIRYIELYFDIDLNSSCYDWGWHN